MTEFVCEIFYDIVSAEQAYQETINQGYQSDAISLVMSETTRSNYGYERNTTQIEEMSDKKHLLEGGLTGGVIGAAFGILTAIGIAAIGAPEVSFLIAGPIFGGLASAGAGAVGGSLVGLLRDRGITEEEAKKHEEEIKNGGIMIGVNVSSQSDKEKLQKKWELIKYQEDITHAH